MLKTLNTATKESIFYKVPAFIMDAIIQVGTLLWILYGTHMIRAKNLPIYEQDGTWVILIGSLLLSIAIAGIHLNERNRSAVNIASLAFLNAFLTWALFNGLMAIIYELTLQGKTLALQLAVTSILTVMVHLFFRQIISLIRRKGANNYPVLMIGSAQNLLSIYDYLIHDSFHDRGYSVLGFFSEEGGEIPQDATRLGGIEDCFGYIERSYPNIKEVLCSLNPATHTETVNRLVQLCENKMVRFKYVPDMEGYPKRKMRFSQLGSVNVISLHDEPLNTPMAAIVKRGGDIVLSLLFLCTLFPFIWLFCAIGIKLSSPGPVFFRQKRTGYEGKDFECLKFRSMHPSRDADTKQAVKGDSRVFPFGEFLRKSSLDELPQFINVLKGDMSIIGPRPHMIHHTDVYSGLIGDYMVRHFAKPGITGWAQINGCRGETKEVEEMKRRVELDIWYIEHWSIELDLSIFFITIWQLLRGGDQKAY